VSNQDQNIFISLRDSAHLFCFFGQQTVQVQASNNDRQVRQKHVKFSQRDQKPTEATTKWKNKSQLISFIQLQFKVTTNRMIFDQSADI
jgi:hypothetical protein